MKYALKHFAMMPLAMAVSTAVASETWQTLETSVVSATGYEQDVRQAPASLSVTTGAELSTKPVTDLGSAIGDVPGVDIGLSKMGNSTISIRGFDAAYTLVLLDGRRQNANIAMMDNGFDPTSTFMPPSGMIERIEVLRGPASLVWGSDAVGGVVNVITKKHPDRFTGSVTVEGQFQQHDEWANRGGTSFYLGVPLAEDRVSLALRGRYNQWGTTRLMTPGDTLATHSPTEGYNENLGARLTVTPDSKNTWWADADFTRFKGGSMNTSSQSIQARRWYHKMNAAIGHEGEFDFGRTDTFLQWNRLDLMKSTSIPNFVGKGSASESHGSFADPLMSSEDWMLSSKVVTPMNLIGTDGMVLTSGVDIQYQQFVNNQSSAGVIEGKTLDQTLLAAFSEGEIFLNDHWSATAGGRVMWSDIFGTHATPRAYLVWKPMDTLSFKGGVAAGYKTPDVRKLTDGIYGTGNNGAEYYGNPNLKPEESWSYELSGTAQLGGVASVTLGGFWTNFKNMLDTETLSDGISTRAINHGRVESRGVELLVTTVPLMNIRFTGGYTFTDAEIKEGADEGRRPNELPRHVLTTRFDWASGPFTAYVKTSSKFDMDVITTKGAPPRSKYKDYTIVDLGGSWQPAKHHTIAWALNNVLDKDTADFEWNPTSKSWGNAYSHYIEGRNLWLSYTYDF